MARRQKNEPETTPFRRQLLALQAAFEVAKREPDGAAYTRIKDGSPEWMTDAVREAHSAIDDGGSPRLPSDWIFATASDVVDSLVDREGADDANGAREYVCDIASERTDIGTHDLTAWLADDVRNVTLCDERAEELGNENVGLVSLIQGGQTLAIQRIAYALIDGIEGAEDAADEDAA